MDILNFYKKLGETPKEALERFKEENPLYKDSVLTYAGRLDPMAEGVLVILAGDIKEEEKKKILELPKTYYFEVLWGLGSDTYDILGLTRMGNQKLFNESKIPYILNELKNLKEMEYPPFSSKPVGGIPLFQIAKSGSLGEIEIPKREVKILSLDNLGDYQISGSDLLELIIERIGLVKGDFRQEEIKNSWKEALGKVKDHNFILNKFRAEVSSGTYIRGLANLMGQKMGSSALCFKILREKVGNYILTLNS